MTDQRPRHGGRPPSGALICLLFLTATLCSWSGPLERALSRGRYTETEQGRIRSLLDQASDQGIDSSLLLPRIEEAAAKRIPAEKLMAALRAEIERLDQSASILEHGPQALRTNAVRQRMANLILWGATEQEIKSLATAADDRPARFAAITSLYVSLVDWGLDRRQSEELARVAGASALNDREVAGITQILASARRRREEPSRVADRLTTALPNVRSLRQLEEQIRYE